MKEFAYGLPPLALYIHMPWCIQKCPYCDFNSHTLKTDLPEAAYIDALLADAVQSLPAIWGRRVMSVFIGGGTPSLFSATSLDRLFSGLRSHFNFSPHAEITLEANPNSVEYARFQEYRAIGINRLSIGIQSFNGHMLKQLGRVHTADEAVKAAETAHRAGFSGAFNLDLMFGLPGQTVTQAEADIKQALALQPAHLSYYQLTLEPNTYFYRYPPILPDDDLQMDIQERGQALLAEQGFIQYEVSAYAQAHAQCQHNLNYWQFGDYVGIGAGAHGKISRYRDDHHAGLHVQRSLRHKHPQNYLHTSADQRVDYTDIMPETLTFEFMLNALRLKEGVPISFFTERTGLIVDHIMPTVIQLQQEQLLAEHPQRLQATPLGYLYLNQVIARFMNSTPL